MQTEATTAAQSTTDRRYARCLENSRKIRWDIDKDVIRGREFDFSGHFLPDGLSMISRLEFLNDADRRLLSHIQGRTYANMFGLVERFINAKVLELSRAHWLGDQVALEALVGFSQEELKHQEMFRRIERMIAAGMPTGYTFLPKPDEVAAVVLGKSTWAVLALTCHIELFVQAHYMESIQPDAAISPLFKDVFLYHWKEESQHAILDELEWRREDAKLAPEQRDQAVADLIGLVAAVDGIVQAQAASDADYFFKVCRGPYSGEQSTRVREGILHAYRWQYIVSGVEEPRFQGVLGSLISKAQGRRIGEALAPIMAGSYH